MYDELEEKEFSNEEAELLEQDGDLPGRNDGRVKKIVAGVLAIAICAGGGFFGYKMLSKNDSPKNDISQSSTEAQKTESSTQEVPYETMSRLSNGTILTFGNKNKQPLTLIVDPSQISRKSVIIDGKPSSLLNAVKDNKIRLNLYLYPSSPERTEGVNSVIKAATCRIGSDKSSSNIFTLVGLVNGADKIKGNENTTQAAKIIGVKGAIKCPAKAKKSAESTFDNAKFFMTNFNTEKPGIIVSGGSRTSEIDSLKKGWVNDAINGAPASSLIKDDAKHNG